MYRLRVCGTNEFVSKIDTTCTRNYPPGEVELVVGWTNPNIKVFATRLGAERAAKLVMKIEGYVCDIEIE